MALLTGLTADGTEVPVQVKPDGKLVAEGLTGPAGGVGPQGVAGPPGPKGDDKWTGGPDIAYLPGRVLIGASTPVTGVNQPKYARLQVIGNTLTGARTGLVALGRSADASTIVDGNGLGGITFGDNAAGEFAHIFGEADGTAGLNNYPGRIVFATTAAGSGSSVERMRIKAAGTINYSSVATYADNTAAKAGGLVAGDVYRKSDGTLMITW